MNDQENKTGVEPTWINIRPIKLAFLIDHKDRINYEKIISYNSSMWSGIFNIIIPVKNQSIIDDFFYSVLTLCSPDYIICLVDISKELEKTLEKDIFPLDIENWITDFKGNSRKILGISLPFGDNPNEIVERFEKNSIIRYDKYSKYLELALKSYFGKSFFYFGKQNKEDFNFNGLKKYFKYFKSIGPSYNRNTTNTSLLKITRSKINILLQSKEVSPQKNIFFILGKKDSLNDFCLFWAIRAIFCDNPVVYLPYKETIDNLDFIVNELYSAVEVNEKIKLMPLMNYYSELDLLSFTIKPEKLHEIAKKVSSHAMFKTYSMGKRNKSVKIFTREDKNNITNILPFYWNISLKRDFKGQILADNFGYIEFQAPESISNKSIGAQFMVDIDFNRFVFPRSKQLLNQISFLPSRISNGGLSCIFNWSKPYLDVKEGETWHNLFLEKSNIIPIRIPKDFQMIESIFEDNGFNTENDFEIKLSDKGNFTNEAIKLFKGLDRIVLFSKENIPSMIFDSFIYKFINNDKITKRPNQYNNTSFSLEKLIKILKSNLKDYENSETDSELKSIVEQLLDVFLEFKILKRGFKLKCSNCLNSEWYSIEKVTNQFECNRCGTKNSYKSEIEWSYKLNEIIFQGFHHNMKLPIYTLYYLSKRCNIFNYIPEIRLIKSKRDWAEIDITCLLDGKLVLGQCTINGEIEKNQMDKFIKVIEKVIPNTIVFSSKKNFKPSSRKRIEQLEKNEIIKKNNIKIQILNENNLFSGKQMSK